MPTQLETILTHTRAELARRRAAADMKNLERCAAVRRPKGFEAALRSAAESGPAVIAELKKASPSKGLIREDFRPAELARGLEDAGAAALSVLTDEKFFQGSLENLELASAAVQIPCLRKDFIVGEFQILEARARGADAVLLIVAAHGDRALEELRGAAEGMELDVLCEVHDREELKRALDLGFSMLGVNSRDLHTMQVSLESQIELAQWLPAGAVKVAESGIKSNADLAALMAAGYNAFLVGESLMREPAPDAALARLLAREGSPRT